MYWFHWYSAPDQWFNYLIDLPRFVKSFSASTYGGTVWSPLLSKPVGRPHEVLEMTKDPQWLYGDKGVFCLINKLGLCSPEQYQWLLVNWSVDEKNVLIIHDNQLINWWKKWIDFVKIKFHLNENVEWHCMQLELNLDSLFNWIEFKYRISMQLNSI
jgi:hypothetical protein